MSENSSRRHNFHQFISAALLLCALSCHKANNKFSNTTENEMRWKWRKSFDFVLKIFTFSNIPDSRHSTFPHKARGKITINTKKKQFTLQSLTHTHIATHTNVIKPPFSLFHRHLLLVLPCYFLFTPEIYFITQTILIRAPSRHPSTATKSSFFSCDILCQN